MEVTGRLVVLVRGRSSELTVGANSGATVSVAEDEAVAAAAAAAVPTDIEGRKMRVLRE